MMKIFLLILISSCTVYGPKTKDKSPLNKLNGDNYHSDVSTNISPIAIQRVPKSTILSGNCFFKMRGDDLKYPVKFKEVLLIKSDKVIAQGNTDHQGHFKLSSTLEDGKYDLMMNNSSFSGKKSVEIRGYLFKDLDFEVSKR